MVASTGEDPSPLLIWGSCSELKFEGINLRKKERKKFEGTYLVHLH
jgi:hypothetical protein